MTEQQYYLLCIGHKEKTLNDLRIERRRQWLLYCSYADPKTMIKTEIDFMPLEGDEKQKVHSISMKLIKKAHDNRFLNLNKRKNA